MSSAKPGSASSAGKPPRMSYGEMSGHVRIVKHIPSKMVSGRRKLAPVQQNYKKTPQSNVTSSANSTINTDSSITSNNSFLDKKDPSMNLLNSFKSAQKSILKRSDHISSSMITEDDSSGYTDATTRMNTMKNKVTKRPVSSNDISENELESTQPRKKKVVVFDDDMSKDLTAQESKDSILESTINNEDENEKKISYNKNESLIQLLQKVFENQKMILQKQDMILDRVENLEKSVSKS